MRSAGQSAVRPAQMTAAVRRFSPFWRTKWGCRRSLAATTRVPSRVSNPPSISTAAVVPAYLNLGDIYARDDKMAQAAVVWEQVIDRVPDRAYLTFDRLSLAYDKARHSRTLLATVPQADSQQSSGLACSSRAGSIPREQRRPERRARAALRGARAQSSCTEPASGYLAGARTARFRAHARAAIRRAHAPRRVLHGSAHLHAMPLSQH